MAEHDGHDAGRIDHRFDAGMAGQLALLQQAARDGARQVGWKAGLGSPSAREMLAIEAPLVGFLLDTTRIEPGAVVDLSDWTEPRAEAEVAVRLGSDVEGGATAAEALAAVEAVAVAIELVDLSPPPTEVAPVLAGNIFHRHWTTGAFLEVDAGAHLSTTTGHVTTMGVELDAVADVQAATGAAGDVLSEVALLASRYGRGLRRGDVVILGAMVPPQPVTSGGAFRVALDGHAAISVSFT